MKTPSRIVTLAIIAAGASAQGPILGRDTVVVDPADSGTTTVYYSVCPTAASTTITLSSTLTYCPGPYCNGGPAMTEAPAAGQPGQPGNGYASGGAPSGYAVGGEYTTTLSDGEAVVYETIFPTTCSTGLQDVTYTITEPCPCSATRDSNSMPSGFSTTVVTCDVCGDGTTVITLTTPCPTGPYASQATNTGGSGAAPAAGSSAIAGSPGAAPTGAAAGPTGAASSPNGGVSNAPGHSYSSAAEYGSTPSDTVEAGNTPSTSMGAGHSMPVSQSKASPSIAQPTGAANHVQILGSSLGGFLAIVVGLVSWLV